MEYLTSREAMCVLKIKSMTTLMKYEKEGVLCPTRMRGSNRKRYKMNDLEKILKGH